MRSLSTFKFWGLTLLLGLACLTGPRLAQAGLAISPLKQEISLRPGETGTVHIKVNHQIRPNITSGPESATFKVVDVVVAENGSLVFPEAGTQKNSASKWLTLGQNSITLDPGKNDAITLTITPPVQAQPGEYYTAIMITMGKLGHSDQGVDLQYQVVSGVFVTVLGQTLPKRAVIARCDIEWPKTPPAPATQPASEKTEDFTPPMFVAVLKNTGAARFDGRGTLRIMNADTNRVVMTAVMTSSRPCVFSGDSRRFQAPLTKPLPPGRYQAKVGLDYESSWSKAYQTFNFDITPEQAGLLARLDKHQTSVVKGIVLGSTKLTPTIPAGGQRSLGLAVRNITDIPTRCLISVASVGDTDVDSWITLDPTDFTLQKMGHKSVEIKVEVPPGTKKGIYTALVAVESLPEGSDMRRMEIPVEIQVKTER